jgi:hypothetical protein
VESRVFTLVLILLIVGIVLAVSLFVGGLFVQGYVYTEPSPALRWGAPLAALALFIFYSAWCLAVAFTAPSDDESSYHILWQFSPTAYQFPPLKEVWAVRKGDKKEPYVLKKVVVFRGQSRYEYRSALNERPWNNSDVQAIIVRPPDGTPDIKYTPVAEADRPRGAYRQFVSKDGWVITESETGPSPRPEKTYYTRLFLFLFLHMFHLGLWFACLWLLLRFQWAHALSGAVVLTITAALIMLPMLVGYAVDVSRARYVPAPNVAQVEAAPQ